MHNSEQRDTISMIAHELRTSLLGEKWALKMLDEGDLGQLDEKQKLFIEKMVKNNNKMVELVTELVEAGHSDESKPLQFTEMNVVKIGKEVIEDFEADAQRRKLSLEYTSPADGIVLAEVNENKIHSAIQELLNNSLKYTKEGSVQLSITEDDNNLFIKVKDTGMGISEEDKDKIFEKFFRGKNAETELDHGSTFTMTLPKKH
jgi:two-component system phosphate regulon sensor histidine kinase PhoR